MEQWDKNGNGEAELSGSTSPFGPTGATAAWCLQPRLEQRLEAAASQRQRRHADEQRHCVVATRQATGHREGTALPTEDGRELDRHSACGGHADRRGPCRIAYGATGSDVRRLREGAARRILPHLHLDRELLGSPRRDRADVVPGEHPVVDG